MNNIKKYWKDNKKDNKKEILKDIVVTAKKDIAILIRILKNIKNMIFLGIFLDIISNSFYPEFAEEFPTIYGWFNGCLQLGEFALKAALGTIYALFTGNISQSWAEYHNAVMEMMQQFVNWLSTL